MTALLVLAKAPVPGTVKTRLCPPCSAGEAALLAEAALADTLATVAATSAERRVLILEGEPGPWLPHGFDVLAQRGSSLDERLAAAFEDTGGPAVLIGMDTPQVDPSLLGDAVGWLRQAPAVLGLAEDGGFWIVGLRRPDPGVFVGLPMGSPLTGSALLRRLVGLNLPVTLLPMLRDVDTFEDARAVAGIAPRTRFARRFRELTEAKRTSTPLAVGARSR